ncbi:MAG TPA: regulatory protein RecX [Candidatus Onthocola gallistercoris]|uniref:Regulatory protein RecX n=1 Tax=Candidatus Onthocola gallistercoris TaxID=2840876 RepID=A0A9D1KX70_9FIRM|nr:regulatory protein RecX [Candidatus Onthocola gallistercoris]
MEIIEIKRMENQKTEIVFDSGESFILPRKDAAATGLGVGDELTEEAWMALYRKTANAGARAYALNLLKVRDRSEKEVRDKLRQHGYDGETTEDVIVWLYGYHYLDDNRFAGNFIRYHSGGKSRREILYRLRQKGIDTIGDEAEEELPDDRETIRKLVVKRCPTPENMDEKERNRIISWLARKGFGTSDIFTVLRELGK